MKSSYEKEYQALIEIIKDKLNDNSIDIKIRGIYETYIEIIEESIRDKKSEETYHLAIDNLLNTLNEIEELDHSNENNYIEISLPHKQDNNMSEEELEYKINKLERQQKVTKSKIKGAYISIISYVLSLSILIGAPISAYIKAKNTPKEKLYKTYKEIHTTLDRDYEVMEPGYIYTNANDVAKYTTTYEKKLPYEETIEIKEYSPWITEGTESMRKVVAIEKDASVLGNRIYETDLPNLVLGYGSHQENEYKYTVEIPYDERNYTQKIYEITRLVQNVNDYIEKDLPISTYTNLIILLLTELLLCFCYREITETTLLENLIGEIIKLKNSKRISKEQSQELEKLAYEYLSINKNNQNKKTKNI